MTSISSELRSRKWVRDSFLISTDTSLVSVPELNAAFASESFYWGKSLPEPVLKETLENSLCFALFDIGTTTIAAAEDLLRRIASTGSASDAGPSAETPRFLGFARLITDFTTFVFVTDVWVDPLTQGKGLGKWLVGCVQEVIQGMDYLRRSMLFTSDWERSVPFYEKLMNMELIESGAKEHGPAVMQMKWKGHPDYVEKKP
ncbi:hypothetical protein EsH8_I_000131 [Colletotrichum jinshuiense]